MRVALDDDALNSEDRPAIEQHRAVSTDALVMSGIVYVCKVRKAFDRDSMKMFFSVHRDAEPALPALTKGLIHAVGNSGEDKPQEAGWRRKFKKW